MHPRGTHTQPPTGPGRNNRRRLLSGRGQTLVEFALILPVVLMLTVGILDVARLFAANIALQNGVREGALYAASGAYSNWCSPGTVGDVPCPASATGHQTIDPNNIAYHLQGGPGDLSAVDITMSAPVVVVCDAPCTPSGSTVTVSASYPFRPLTPGVSLIMGSLITLRASATAQIQN